MADLTESQIKNDLKAITKRIDKIIGSIKEQKPPEESAPEPETSPEPEPGSGENPESESQ